MSAADETAKALAAVPGVRRERGLCVAVDEAMGLAEMNMGGGRQWVPMLGRPTVGHDAWVLYIKDQPLLIGPVYRAVWAVVSGAPDGGKVTVLRDDGVTSTLPYAASLDLVLGDRVTINWASGLVDAEPASEPVAVLPDAPAPATGGEKTLVFQPTDSGTQNAGSGSFWSQLVWASNTTRGAYFYRGIADSLPDNAVIVSVRIFLNSEQTQGDNPNIGLHDLGSKSGVLTVTNQVAVPKGTGWKDLPPSFGDLLKVGAKLGVGTNQGGFNKFSAARVNNSGALEVVYRG